MFDEEDGELLLLFAEATDVTIEPAEKTVSVSMTAVCTCPLLSVDKTVVGTEVVSGAVRVLLIVDVELLLD